MASYVVMEPPARGAGEATLVRDGFHVFAFILPVVWLLFYRLWIEAVAVLALSVLIGVVGSRFGLGGAASAASLALGILVGLEAAAMKIAALRRRGWREWGVVEAENAGDAEIRYLSELADAETADDPAPNAPARNAPTRPDIARYGRQPAGPALGMLGYPAKG